MEDIDKTRAEYVVNLEARLEHALRELAVFKPAAELWTMNPTSSVDLDTGEIRISLNFGGTMAQVSISLAQAIANHVDDLTSAAAQTLCTNLMFDKVRVAIQPEIDRAVRNARTLPGAGKW